MIANESNLQEMVTNYRTQLEYSQSLNRIFPALGEGYGYV